MGSCYIAEEAQLRTLMAQGDGLWWSGRDVHAGVHVCAYTRLTHVTIQQKHNIVKILMLLFSCPVMPTLCNPMDHNTYTPIKSINNKSPTSHI